MKRFLQLTIDVNRWEDLTFFNNYRSLFADDTIVAFQKKVENHIRWVVAHDELFASKYEVCGDGILEDFFPDVDVDVFISHSHDDLDLAKAVAGYIQSKSRSLCFIDSCVWGNIDILLKNLNEKFCQKSINLYDYDTSNHVTKHALIMLTTALSRIMFKASIFIFLNTRKSIVKREDDGRYYIKSPWLYHELSFSRIMHDQQMLIPENFSENQKRANVWLNRVDIMYRAPVEHLTEISVADLKRWWNE